MITKYILIDTKPAKWIEFHQQVLYDFMKLVFHSIYMIFFKKIETI